MIKLYFIIGREKVSKKIFNYVFTAIFAILLITFFSLLKPITSFFIESYTSNLLEQKVKISSLDLGSFSIQAYIQDPQNKIEAKIITISPLKIEASFSGDIDAFKKYHNLSGDVEAKATITYDEKLLVDANGTLYDASVLVNVEELSDGWFVGVNSKDLSLSEFKKQNSLEFDFDGVVNFELEKQNKEFKLSGSLESKIYDIVELDAKGEFDDSKLDLSSTLRMKDKKLHLNRVFYDLKAHKGSISSKEFAGVLDLALNDEELSLDAKALDLEKLLDFLEYKDSISGVVDIKGEFNIKSKKSSLLLTSPKISAFEQEIKNIKLNIPDLEFLDKKVSFAYNLDATYLKKAFRFDGELSYKDTLYIVASSSDFKSNSRFELDNEEIIVNIKKLDIEEFSEFFELNSYLSGVIDLDAKGNFDRFIFHLNSDAKLSELGVKVSADGFFITKTKELNSKFKLSTKLAKEEVKVRGDASFKDVFRLNASSSSFGARSNLTLRGDRFEFYTKDLDIQRVARAYEKTRLPFGKVDFLASGDFKEIALNLRSKELRRNMHIKNIDDYISFDLSGTYKNKTLSIKDKINLHHKTKKLPLNIDATISLIAPYSSKGSLVHKEDKIIVDSFSFEDEQIKSSFEVDIDDLFLYKAAFSTPLHGPLHIEASFSDVLHIRTKSFGGELDLSLDKSYVLLDINKVQAKKVAYLFDKNTHLESGLIDGYANYEINEKKAHSEIVLKDAILRGLDIDKMFKDIDDLLGLNILNMTKSIILHYYDEKEKMTKISQLQLDLSLEDSNIKLDDVALKTRELLVVAQGELKDSGDIKRLTLSVVDKNGCAIVTQALSGNLKSPEIASTTSALIDLMQNIPTAILKPAKQLVDFGATAIDNIATFGLKHIFRSDSNVSMTSDLISQSRSIDKFVYDMIMPWGCKVIYTGKVKHPANSKEDLK